MVSGQRQIVERELTRSSDPRDFTVTRPPDQCTSARSHRRVPSRAPHQRPLRVDRHASRAGSRLVRRDQLRVDPDDLVGRRDLGRPGAGALRRRPRPAGTVRPGRPAGRARPRRARRRRPAAPAAPAPSTSSGSAPSAAPTSGVPAARASWASSSPSVTGRAGHGQVGRVQQVADVVPVAGHDHRGPRHRGLGGQPPVRPGRRRRSARSGAGRSERQRAAAAMSTSWRWGGASRPTERTSGASAARPNSSRTSAAVRRWAGLGGGGDQGEAGVASRPAGRPLPAVARWRTASRRPRRPRCARRPGAARLRTPPPARAVCQVTTSGSPDGRASAATTPAARPWAWITSTGSARSARRRAATAAASRAPPLTSSGVTRAPANPYSRALCSAQ